MDLQLQDRVVVLAGGTGGIGRSVCEEFLLEGATVVALYRGDETKLEPLYSFLKESALPEERLWPFAADYTDTAQHQEVVDKIVEKFGRIDIFVNSVGGTVEIPFLGLKEELFDDILSVNFTATAGFLQHVLKQMMKQKKGSVVNISSVVGEKMGRGIALYSAAKAALDRLTQVLAIELGKKGIRLNAVAPGLIKTDMSKQVLTQEIPYPIPLNRFGDPEDIAKAVCFLASDVSAYTTGHVMTIDGGISL